jgi:hypothetical protein
VDVELSDLLMQEFTDRALEFGWYLLWLVTDEWVVEVRGKMRMSGGREGEDKNEWWKRGNEWSKWRREGEEVVEERERMRMGDRSSEDKNDW